MSQSRTFTLTLAALAMVASADAMAGSWPNLKARKADQPAAAAPAQQTANAAQQPIVSTGGFEFIGGEAGWQPAVAKYEFSGGGLVHASDCPLTVASVASVPAGKSLYDPSPGA